MYAIVAAYSCHKSDIYTEAPSPQKKTKIMTSTPLIPPWLNDSAGISFFFFYFGTAGLWEPINNQPHTAFCEIRDTLGEEETFWKTATLRDH